jgi:hypothetical protein
VLNLFIAVIVNAMQDDAVNEGENEVLAELRAIRAELATLKRDDQS